jgi:hypothetical protein
METENKKLEGGLFKRFRKKISGKQLEEAVADAPASDEPSQKMLKEFEAVKKNPGHLTGWDFDRAFDFIERYPESSEAEILIGQMYATTGQDLKGLSYMSAMKVLERMPGHAGKESILRGMYKIESDYIEELRSDVIAYMLKTIPDHPLAAQLTEALARKNLTIAYEFITDNPDNTYVRDLITAMFDRDANIAVLLLQEKMDHPKVDAIFEGIYNITERESIDKLTPNAVIFILEVAPDHPQIDDMIEVMVESNYVKAYEFAKTHPDNLHYETIKNKILAHKPELESLFAGLAE